MGGVVSRYKRGWPSGSSGVIKGEGEGGCGS